MKQYINGIGVKSTNCKKYAALLESYRHAVNMRGYRMVHDCYGNPSAAKDAAENEIWLKMKERNGYGYAVTSYNPMFFSCAYLFPHPVAPSRHYHVKFRYIHHSIPTFHFAYIHRGNYIIHKKAR